LGGDDLGWRDFRQAFGPLKSRKIGAVPDGFCFPGHVDEPVLFKIDEEEPCLGVQFNIAKRVEVIVSDTVRDDRKSVV